MIVRPIRIPVLHILTMLPPGNGNSADLRFTCSACPGIVYTAAAADLERCGMRSFNDYRFAAERAHRLEMGVLV